MAAPVLPLPLSVIVISYNMAREIPRTIQSLSTRMQHNINEQDYEIILIDNGSTQLLDEQLCRCLAGNLRVIRMPSPTPSPVPAINLGLTQARGGLIGVLIDGARIASPGLLSTALRAAATHEKPVIGTLAFHLGPDVQSRSIANGYCQSIEDEMLASSRWDEDGYRLFHISVLAHSSYDGWFSIPSETNALFLKKAHWKELGGYDEHFSSPGGGLANLDAWARACALPDSQVIMLLGEATFHQIHGGIATNSATSKWDHFHHEYMQIRGHAYQRPEVQAVFHGALAHVPAKTLEYSIHRQEKLVRTKESNIKTLTVQGRPYYTSIPGSLLESIQTGVMRTVYRGIPFLKSPFDIGIYLQLLSKVNPKSVIEIGTKHGGSALWFADMLSASGVENPTVISIDIARPPQQLVDQRITFLTGDASALDAVLSKEFLDTLPHPWLVVEDSSHLYEDTLAVLEFFDEHVIIDDYIVVEDGVVSFMQSPIYKKYMDGPNCAAYYFLSKNPTKYEVDITLCDQYGKNVTYNPNGYLRRRK